jgi:hypothetical protein
MKKPYLTFAIVVTTLLLSGTQSTIVDLYNNLFATIETAIDWGIIFIALAILTLIVLTFRKNAGSIFRHWNKLLGHHRSTQCFWCIKNFRAFSHRNYFIPSESNRITKI